MAMAAALLAACGGGTATGGAPSIVDPGTPDDGKGPLHLPLPSPGARDISSAACRANEPNETPQTATRLNPGSHGPLGICDADDVDVFRVEVPARKLLDARIDFIHGDGDLDLYFSDGTLDQEGALRTLARSAGKEDGEEIINVPIATASTVFVVVRGHEGARAQYRLHLRIANPVPERDCFSGCADLIALPGSDDRDSDTARRDGYYIETPRKYAHARRDLAALLRYAANEVQRRFPGTAQDTLAVNDVCQADGLTPGTDVGRPRHPTSTHVRGKDIDLAYFQSDGRSNGQIICGDGSDNNPNGRPGQFNDGYFCTTDRNVVDVRRQVWFMAKLAESHRYRVLGIDQTLVEPFEKEARRLYEAGEIGLRQYRRITTGLGYGTEGGWQFHHHHIHLSLAE
jgi:hypothetical protein